MYNYQEQRSTLFTEDGMERFTKIRDHVKQLLDKSGAVTMSKAISVSTGINWEMMAAVDYMLEKNEIVEVTGPNVAGQCRVFVKPYNY